MLSNQRKIHRLPANSRNSAVPSRAIDLRSLNGMTIGAYGMAAEKIRRLEEFLSINGLNCTIKQYSNEEFTASNEMYDYLENGDVDRSIILRAARSNPPPPGRKSRWGRSSTA